MEGPDASAVRNGTGEFGEFRTEECTAPGVWYAVIFLRIGRVEIAAAAFGDFDDGIVVVPADAM